MDRMVQKLRLKLFVSGATALSVKAILAVKAACSKTDPRFFDLEIIDVLQSKGVAREENLLPLPSLFLFKEDVTKRFIGSEIQNFTIAKEFRTLPALEACQ